MFVYRLFLVFFQHDKKNLLLLLGQLSACEKQLPVFPKIFFTSPAIFSHWSHPWDSANPLHLGWPGCCWCYTRDFPVGHCRICRIFIGCHCRKHENMNWMCTNVIGRCRMYQTTWTSNECAGTGTSLQSSVCRELRLLDFGKPSLGVVSIPDKQRPGLFNLGSFGHHFSRLSLWDGSGVEFAPSLCTVHRQREGDRPAAYNGKFFDAGWIVCADYRVKSSKFQCQSVLHSFCNQPNWILWVNS
jgi:hypothetical protein